MNIKTLLAKLVAIPSFSKEEEKIAQFIYDYFKEKKAHVINQNGNIIVHIQNNSKNAIIFNAHMDTVNVQSGWFTDPFTLTEKDNKLYGLGVSDEKISSAILMHIYDEIKTKNADIFLTFVKEEETTGKGSEIFTQWFQKNYSYTNAIAILTEPRNAKHIGLGHKGSIFFTFQTKGKAAHSSKPHDGDNAIIKAWNTITKIQKNIEQFSQEDQLGKVILACPTLIEGGTSINTIPDTCTVSGTLRTNKIYHDKIIDYFKNLHCDLLQLDISDPYLIDINHPLVQFVMKQKMNIPYYTQGTNDSYFFGRINIPTIVIGAGNEEIEHQANEYIEIDNIEKTKQVYLNIIHNYFKK